MSDNEGIPEKLRITLNQYFANDIKKLEIVLGRDLDLWKKN